MSHLNLARGIHSLLAFGVIHAINKRTGEVTHMSVADYANAQKCGMLDGYFVRLDPVAAAAVSSEIQNRKETIS